MVIISGHGNIEIAVAAVQQGAYDFIEKPFNMDQLMVVLTRALEASRLRRENASLRVNDAQSNTMIGNSSALRTLKSQLDKVTRGNGRVMLTGAAGSGKEVAARYIHAHSERAQGRFVTVNCATIEPAIMEDKLFGRMSSERGHEPGLFEQAHGGVLFFDEIADMPKGTQSKILRVLVDQSFQRPESSDTVRVDVRVISATTRDLKAEIAAERFREELYHRLNVVPISVPTLEERRDDIPALARHFMEELNATQGLPKREMTMEAEAHLQTMSWPGNVRQLRNIIERCLILGPDSGPIEPRELAGDPGDQDVASMSAVISASYAGMALREAREAFEREYLLTQINRFGGNISRTANFVGMERSALHRKLKSLSIMSGGRKSAEAPPVDDDAEEAASA